MSYFWGRTAATTTKLPTQSLAHGPLTLSFRGPRCHRFSDLEFFSSLGPSSPSRASWAVVFCFIYNFFVYQKSDIISVISNQLYPFNASQSCFRRSAERFSCISTAAFSCRAWLTWLCVFGPILACQKRSKSLTKLSMVPRRPFNLAVAIFPWF